MKRFALASFLPIFSSLFSNASISQTAPDRHLSMEQYFDRPAEEVNQHGWWDRKYMFGDWGGLRRSMAASGVTIGASYVTDMLANPVGGKARGFAYDGSMGASIDIDFTKAGIPHLHLYSSACWRTGTNLSSRKIDNQFTVSQLYGSQTVRLNELYLRQDLLDQRLIWKFGRLNAGNDFLCSPLYWHYVNNGFDGNPVSIFFNIPFTAYPNATWGAFLEGKPFEWLSAKFGVYNANSKIQKNKYHGTNFTFSSTNGVVWITEWCGLVNQGKESRGLPGNYKVGFYYLTGSTKKFSGGSESGDPGMYFLFDQMIYNPPGEDKKRGVTPFISVLLQPENRNLMPLFVNGGVVYQGPFASRPLDSASFGFIYGSYSGDLEQKQKRLGQTQQTAETVLELNYWFQINQWFYIMPDLQYIIHPKGTHTPNAFVIGAQIGLEEW